MHGRLRVLPLPLLLLLVAGCGSTHVVTVTTHASPQKHQSFTALLARVRTGVIRIETTTCDEQEVGTGIIVGPSLVATVEHVVDGAASIVLKQNGKVVGRGTVVGADQGRDVALVRSSRPIVGYRFRFAARAPQLGETVTAIGFPLALPLTVTRGLVSGLDRTIPIDGIDRARLVQTDAAVNPGNSGGPLMSDSGQVVGLVDLGTNQANGLAFAVSAQVAGPLVASWRAAPQVVPPASCTAPAAAPTPPATQTTTQSYPTYNGGGFSIAYPAGWVVSHILEGGGNLDTTISPPGNNQVLIRVDENPAPTVTTADAAAAPVIADLRKDPSYVELGLTNETFAGVDALRWEFEVTEHGVQLHKIDEFFIDSSGRGWGVLVEAPETVWAQVATPLETLRQTFMSH